MAKAPVMKFPRIQAGFYSITLDGALVGYVMKEVDSDTKESNWYIFDDNEPGKDIAMLHPVNAIDTPDALLREAKESAKNYFLNKPLDVEAVSEAIQLNEEDWDDEDDDELDLEGLDDDLQALDDLELEDDDEDLDDDELELELEEAEAELALV